MVRLVQGLIALVGRALLVAIFLISAIGNNIPNYPNIIREMEARNIPYPNLLLPGAIVFLIAGGISVLIGYRARLGALLLLVFLVPASYYFHDFWNLPDGKDKINETIHFFKNVSMMGAMVFLIAVGAGPGSVDEATKRRATA
jgi:putative oxidoreductase